MSPRSSGNWKALETPKHPKKKYSSFMQNGTISQPTKLLYGVKNMTQERLATDGLREKCKKKIRSKGKAKRKPTLRLSKIS